MHFARVELFRRPGVCCASIQVLLGYSGFNSVESFTAMLDRYCDFEILGAQLRDFGRPLVKLNLAIHIYIGEVS